MKHKFLRKFCLALLIFIIISFLFFSQTDQNLKNSSTNFSTKTILKVAQEDLFTDEITKCRRRQVDNLIEEFDKIYFSFWHDFLLKNNWTSAKTIKCLSFSCSERGGQCGGIGDRILGVVSAFYLSLTLKRLFHIDWTKNTGLDVYYRINSDFYKVDSKLYEIAYQSATKGKLWAEKKLMFIGRIEEDRLLSFAKNKDIKNELDLANLVQIKANSPLALEGILENDELNKEIALIIDKAGVNQSCQGGGSVDIPVLISAAIKKVFNQPTQWLETRFQTCVIAQVGQMVWLESFRIGIQIRRGETTARTKLEQLHCFIEKLNELIDQMPSERRIVVFLTSDVEESVDLLRRNLTMKRQGIFIIDSNQLCKSLGNQHSDSNSYLRVILF